MLEAKIDYSLIQADLKPGMFFLHDDRVSYVSTIDDNKVSFVSYKDAGNRILSEKYDIPANVADEIIGTKIIKLIAIIDNNPISINHQSYRRFFSYLLNYDDDRSEANITKFVKRELTKQFFGDITSIYSLLEKDDEVLVNDIRLIDKYQLYDPTARLFKVIMKYKSTGSYKLVSITDEKKIIFANRSSLVRSDNDKYFMFTLMDFGILKKLIAENSVKPVKSSGRNNASNNENVIKSKYIAVYECDAEGKYGWYAYDKTTKLMYPIVVTKENYPKYVFSNVTNDYWLPGTVVKSESVSNEDAENFVPFRRNLPIFGKIVDGSFILNNVRQNMANKVIYDKRDTTEERRSELTLKKLATL